MSHAKWSVEARGDMAALDDEFAELSPDYAYRVGRAALSAGRFLAEHPRAGPVFDGTLPKWRVTRTEYVLVYRIVPEGVETVRLQHARRDWRPRGR